MTDFLIFELATSLSPCQFSRVMLSLEMTMTLGPAKPEVFTIISNKHDSMTRVDWT